MLSSILEERRLSSNSLNFQPPFGAIHTIVIVGEGGIEPPRALRPIGRIRPNKLEPNLYATVSHLLTPYDLSLTFD